MTTLVLEQRIQTDVLAAARGDRNAYGRLVDACRITVCSIALAVTRDVAASEDIAQEVFLAAWRSLPRLRNPASFLPYLRQTTRNIAHTQLRDPERRFTVGDVDGLIAAAVDPAPDHPERLIRSEDERALAEVIDALEEEAREVITIFYREGQSVEQVAELLGLQQATVRKRLSRARARIRADLLARFAQAARASAPGAAFTSFVVGALGAGSPPAALAATASLAQGAGAGVAGKIAAAIGGAAMGAALGIAGVVYGLRRNFARARDAQERRDLRRMMWSSIVIVAAVAFLMGPGAPPAEHWLAPTAAYLFLVAFLGVAYLYWLPRITRRSRAAELHEDPRASLRHRRDIVWSWIGWSLGASMGGLGLYYGLVKSGLLP